MSHGHGPHAITMFHIKHVYERIVESGKKGILGLGQHDYTKVSATKALKLSHAKKNQVLLFLLYLEVIEKVPYRGGWYRKRTSQVSKKQLDEVCAVLGVSREQP